MPETATLTVRRYEPRDEAEVLSLHRRAIEEIGAYDEGLSDYLDGDLDDIEKSYIEAGGDFLVGILDGKVVAMGALKRTSDDEADLKRMRVEPGFQRRGLGRTMLHRLEDRAVELGITTLKLDTTVGQIGARRLYENAGYSVAGTGRIGAFDCLFYRKELS